jgi:hypothetical protein
MLRLPHRASLYWEAAVRLVVVGTVSLSVVGLVLGYFGMYVPALVVPFTGACAAALWWLWPDRDVRDPHDAGAAWWVGLLVIGALTLLHVVHAGHYLFVTRDPGFYALMGLELADGGDLTFAGIPDVFARTKGLSFSGQGYALSSSGDVTYSQSFHGFSVVMAPLAWVGGTSLYLKAPAVIGGLSLIVFRRLAVRITSSGWIATALTAALGVSLPFAVFARDPYSEILSLLFVLGTLLVLAEGAPTPRRLAVAGVVAGAGAGVRIDGLLFCAGILFVMLCLPMLGGRRPSSQQVGATVLGLGVPTAIGYAVGAGRSPRYFSDLGPEVAGQLFVLAAAVVAVVIVVVVREFAVRGRGPWTWLRLHDPRRSNVVAVSVAVAGYAWWFLAPAALELHRGKGIPLVAGLQEREGAVVDATRTYGEASLQRLGWHYGDLVVLFAVLGTALAVRSVMRRRTAPLFCVLVVGASAAPYLMVPQITPDMPWAMRRFLPIVIPIMLLLAGHALNHVRNALLASPWVVGALLVAVVGAPALVLAPVAGVRRDVPAVALVETICEAVPDDTAMVIENSRMAVIAPRTLSSLCDIDVATLDPDHDPEDAVVAAARAATEHKQRLVLLVSRDAAIPEALAAERRVPVGLGFEFIRRTLGHVPSTSEAGRYDLDLVFLAPERG